MSHTESALFGTVLVANRGEIAVRVMRTLRRMGIRSVAVYSDADAGSRHVAEADVAVRIGPAAAAQSYLSIDRILDAARQTAADAVHPGYGFLAESSAFAAECERAGLVFIGPPASAIEAMGDKIGAKRMVAAAGVPVVPGRAEPGMSDRDLTAAAADLGYPVLLKPSGGGGGKGMRLVETPAAMAAALAATRREAMAAFGDDQVLVERFVSPTRHIEIQVLGDSHGDLMHLGERECSLQRRHQKIVEEAPSPLLAGLATGERLRQRMGQAAIDAAKAVGYVGAGTVEFIVPVGRPDEFFFLEMNTRLQVEHAVTELVYDIDLVEQQLRVAAGEKLAVSRATPRGHAVEVRVYAEDPARDFLPTGGRVLALREPVSLVRVDSGLSVGTVVTSDYDPMLAKYVAHADSRDEALRLMRSALRETTVLGVTTNIDFLGRLLGVPEVVAGRLDTDLVRQRLDQLVTDEVPDEVFVAVAMERALALEPASPDAGPWDIPGGWRIGEHAWTRRLIGVPQRPPVEVRSRGRASAAEVTVGAGEPCRASARWVGEHLVVECAGRVRRYTCARDGAVLWLGFEGRTWTLTESEHLTTSRTDRGSVGGPVTSPMPGTVLAVQVRPGDRVLAGAPLVIVEAMKMEYTVTAPVDGQLTDLRVRVGQQVALGEPLAVITREETS